MSTDQVENATDTADAAAATDDEDEAPPVRVPPVLGRHVLRSLAVDAERYLAGVSMGLLDGSYIDPARSRLTVGEWSGPWMAGRVHLKPKTLSSYRSLLRTKVLPRWESVALARISHADVVAWVSDLRESGLSASQTRQAYHLFASMLDDAVKDSRLSRNPASGVDLPRLPQQERRYLSHEQVAA